VIRLLRPHPHRGDVVAAGAVPLAVAAFLIDLRMTQWGVGARFVVVGLLSGLVLTMGWLAPLESDVPRAYHSVLLVAGLLAVALALGLLAELLGAARPPGAGGQTWTFGLLSLLAAGAARRANSGACTLIAALAAAIALQELVSWVFAPHGPGTFRALLLFESLAFVGGALRLRDSRRRHAVQLVNAAGLLALVLGLSYLIATGIAALLRRAGAGAFFSGSVSAPFGWKLYLLAVGFGLVAYAAVDREPGPAYIGVAVLAVFAVLAGLPVAERGSLVGWPLFLLLIGAIGLGVGLRPRQPLPPPPPAGNEPAPTVPLRDTSPK